MPFEGGDHSIVDLEMYCPNKKCFDDIVEAFRRAEEAL